MNLATEYIDGVLDGSIDVCEYVKGAMKRHVSDLGRVGDSDFPYTFDEVKAQRPIDFFSVCKHYKGRFKGQNFVPLPWQSAILWITFGWVDEDGFRRFKYQYVEVPRKNGKSTFVAVEDLLLLVADGENAPEIYFTATTQAQASIVFKEAREIAKETPELTSRLDIQNYLIKNPANNGFMKALGGDSKTQDGLNPSGASLDEYHEHKTDDMFNVIDSAFGMRWQPLMSVITTAGFNKNYPCYQYRDHCIKVIQGTLRQDDLFAVIYTIDEGDDWKDESSHIKANPSWEVMNKKDFRKMAEQARVNPAKEVPFLTKKLNVWTNAESIWVSDEDWMACAGPIMSYDSLKDVPCYAGLDLAKSKDLNALVLNFPIKGKRHTKYWFWIPEKKVREKEDIVDYFVWRKQGYINICGGDVINQDELATDVYKILSKYNVKGMAYDRWGSDGFIQALIKKGIPIDRLHPFKQTTLDMTKPVNELIYAVSMKTLNHEGNPVMRWMASNGVLDIRSDGSLKFDKEKAIDKIDGLVALCMAIGEEMEIQKDGPISYKPTFI